MATTFGQRIRSLREAAGLSRNQLAAKSGLTYSAIYNIETGISKEPQFSSREALAQALDMSLNQLSGESVENEEGADKARAYSIFMRLESRGMNPCELADLFESMPDESRDMVIQLARMFGGASKS